VKKLNRQGFIFSVAAVFALVICFDFIVHQVLLADMYWQTEEVWRTPQHMQMLPMFASQLFYALMFVYIFTRNYENKGIREGVRFGLYIGLLLAAIKLSTYGYLPIPFSLTLSWMVAAIIGGVLSGIVVALVYRK
jgi:uncharacterized membrane-anchored protein YitT (DUF2179 family)